MALEFKVFERAENTLNSLGTVLENVGKNGSLSVIPANLKDTSKRVVIILKKADGTSTGVTCSKKVSDGIRNKEITMSNVLGFDILEGESGVPFISMPAGEALQAIAVKDLKPKAYEPKTVSDMQELIAL